MNASAVLKAASAAGVQIAVDRGDLVLAANTPPPDEIIDALFCHKADIIALMKSVAVEKCVVEWLNQHSEPSEPDQCAWCKQTDLPEHVIVPFGSNLHGHTWLHPECWSEWIKHRRKKAVQALLARGIREPHVGLQEP